MFIRLSHRYRLMDAVPPRGWTALGADCGGRLDDQAEEVHNTYASLREMGRRWDCY
jgi:hypothetical protein